MKEYIVDEKKENRGKHIIKIAEEIKLNINNSAKIWEVKRQLEQVTKKSQIKQQLKNDKGKILQQKEEILKQYESYYTT